MDVPAPSRPACPESDVSHGAGLAGLAGLLAWVQTCRHWPALADTLGLGGPRLPLAGPSAALLCLLATALPMLAWSLLVDRVHRRPSTGLNWANPRPWREIRQTAPVKLLGLWAAWALIGAAYCLARWCWQDDWLFAMRLLGLAAIPLTLASIPYVFWLERHLAEPHDGAWHFGAALLGRPGWRGAELARFWRIWAVKGFFCAFMLSIVPGGFAGVVGFDYHANAGDPVRLSGWLTDLLFLIDVQVGTVGYLFTLRPLDAHIRSANPRLSGWVAALVCYPPLVLMADGGVLDYHRNTAEWSVWFSGHPALLWVWGAWLVALTGVYAWATVAFGPRFSNLTWRGTITHGPYRLTRHPAYLAKNLFWWSSALPFLATTHSPVDSIRNTATLAMVSAIYYWRARTEEAHLLAEDPKYRAYWQWMEENAAVTRALKRLLPALSAPGDAPAARRQRHQNASS